MYPSMIVESTPGWKGTIPGITETKERKEPQGLKKSCDLFIVQYKGLYFRCRLSGMYHGFHWWAQGFKSVHTDIEKTPVPFASTMH